MVRTRNWQVVFNYEIRGWNGAYILISDEELRNNKGCITHGFSLPTGRPKSRLI